MTQPSLNSLIAFCQENGFPYEENTDGTITIDSQTYQKVKTHPDVDIKDLTRGGLLAGNLYDDGGIHFGHISGGKLIIAKKLEGGQYMTHVVKNKEKIARYIQMNNEVSNDTPSIPFIRPKDCNLIDFSDVKIPILIDKRRGTRFIIKNAATALNIEEIVAIDIEEKGNPVIGCFIFLFILAIPTLLIWWIFF